MKRCALALLLLIAAPAAAAPPSSPELAVTVSLEREDLKAGETNVPVQVWLSNPSDIAIGPVEVWLAGPESIHLAGSPKQPELDHLTLLPSLAPHQDSRIPLHLTVDDKVREGDYNLLFGFRYHTGTGVGVATVEKKVQLGVLGTESVGGFSLRLVALLLPGLLFWMVLQLFQAGTALQAAFDKGALAVLTSLLLLAIVTYRPPPFLAGGMSLLGLLFLCALGAGLGLGLGGLIVLVRKTQRERARERTVQPRDSDEATMRKLLALPDGDLLLNAEIQLRDGRRLQGSLAGPTPEGFVIVGSYRVTARDAALRKELSDLEKQGQWTRLLDRAREAGLTWDLDRAVKVNTGKPGEPWRDLGLVYRLSEEDIASQSAGKKSWPPVSVTP
jgi:hypothetical protein